MYIIGMKKLELATTMLGIDDQAQTAYGIPALSLMETAGIRIWEQLKPLVTPGERLTFLVGGGNNGGDALVVARLAYNDGFKNLLCILIGQNISESCSRQRNIVEAYNIAIVSPGGDLESILDESHWIIDGLCGTGLKGPLRGEQEQLVRLSNKSSAKKLAIDIPSGLGDEVPCNAIHIKANLTVTMGLGKAAMYHPKTRGACGQIVVANPSFPPQLLEAAPSSLFLCDLEKFTFPALQKADFKNKRGHVALFGGSEQYTGAIRLAARSAFSARVGLVSLFCDEKSYLIAASESPSVMVRHYDPTLPLDTFDALLAGPGWGKGREAELLLLFASGKPMVLDADGILGYASLLGEGERPEHGPLIVTPHLGELQKLCSAYFGPDSPLALGNETPDAFYALLRRLAKDLNSTLVVKSSLVHIVDPVTQKIFIVEGLNPSLGVAGSGDVLSGILVALLANDSDLVNVALQGTLAHQMAGLLAHAGQGYYDAQTLIEYVGKAIMEVEA